ncbi:thiamine pyrophosphate-binding protein [Enterococcus cecorum]
MNKQQEMTGYLRHLIAGLKQGGVRQVVISPGSRSTPLALLVKRESDLQYFVAVDERSAGFLALGLAKGSQQPVALLCTSGTAAANFYPADL